MSNLNVITKLLGEPAVLNRTINSQCSNRNENVIQSECLNKLNVVIGVLTTKNEIRTGIIQSSISENKSTKAASPSTISLCRRAIKTSLLFSMLEMVTAVTGQIASYIA
ncbi:hypothetical protein Ark11_1575 [Candidatus Ichthyocystis hellenicum]|uniref:Uncharacterized protein n=1 Tax=Candidatus Ichthyocystis hellenicum TaxID=1561003 RepID=A0A0S4M579_9BURK|nr:hypothetical protein Ark11_1575 [Candidatus Ichthyocystis hellenicum]